MPILNLVTSLLTSFELYVLVGLALTVYQLKQFEKRQKTSLENELNREYRSIVGEMPVDALLDNEVKEWPDTGSNNPRLEVMYPYIDLSNQQVFLRKRGRITKSRWKDWEEGIETHLSQTEFQKAWVEIKDETEGPVGKSFEELRQLEGHPLSFDTDPYYWDVPWWRVPLRKSWELAPFL